MVNIQADVIRRTILQHNMYSYLQEISTNQY